MAQSAILKCPHRLPHFAACCIDGLVCAEAIQHSEPGDVSGAASQLRIRAASDHVSLPCGLLPAVGVQKQNDLQQGERVSTVQVR
jgi:hypothetical protein